MATVLESLRSAMNTKGATAVAAAAVVVLSVACVIVYRQLAGSKPPAPPAGSYYLDESAWDPANPVIRPASEIPPLAGSGGAMTLVRAVYYTESTDAEKKLAYVEKYLPEAREVLLKNRSDMKAENDGAVVRESEPGLPWVKRYSAEGLRVVNKFSVQNASDRSKFRIVLPP